MDIFERMKKQAEARANQTSKGGKVEFWSPPPGRHVVRVVPFDHGSDTGLAYSASAWHFNVAPNTHVQCRGHWDPTIQTRTGYGVWQSGDCPFCKIRDNMPKEEQGKMAWDHPLKTRPQFYYNMIIRGDKEDTFVTARVNVSTHRGIDNAVDQYIQAKIDPLHPETGVDMAVVKQGKGKETSYAVTPLTQKPLGMDVEPKDLIALKGTPKTLEELEPLAKDILDSMNVPS